MKIEKTKLCVVLHTDLWKYAERALDEQWLHLGKIVVWGS